MTVDTPIVDRDVRADLVDSRALADRLDRGELFRKYLDAQHIPLKERAFLFDWLSASKILEEEMGRISERVQQQKAEAIFP
jgi:hypothetical protein